MEGTIAVTGTGRGVSVPSRGPATVFMKALTAKFGADVVSPFAGYSENASTGP